MHILRMLLLAVLSATSLFILPIDGAGEAGAAFPGENGRIVFGDFDGTFQIFSINPDGSGKTNLSNGPGDDTGAQWSPDGSRIAFVSDRDGNGEIYVMDADGAGQTNLSNGPEDESTPRWSPDGSRILFERQRGASPGLYVMDANGSNVTQVTEYLGTPNFHAFAWSPNGSQIAFESEEDGTVEIYVVNADGSDEVNLSSNPAYDQFPTWSPDGSQLAFTSDRGGDFDIYVMNADGSGVTNLSDNPAFDFFPVWSTDGSRIFFVSNRVCIAGLERANLVGAATTARTDRFDSRQECLADAYVMNADGTTQTLLTDELTIHASFDPPVWSPDSSQIAYTSQDLGIYVIDADGGRPRRLAGALGFGLDWQPVVAAGGGGVPVIAVLIAAAIIGPVIGGGLWVLVRRRS